MTMLKQGLTGVKVTPGLHWSICGSIVKVLGSIVDQSSAKSWSIQNQNADLNLSGLGLIWDQTMDKICHLSLGKVIGALIAVICKLWFYWRHCNQKFTRRIDGALDAVCVYFNTSVKHV